MGQRSKGLAEGNLLRRNSTRASFAVEAELAEADSLRWPQMG